MVMTKSEARSLTFRQQKGRAVNAVAEMLEKRLAVPKIYLEPNSQLIAADVFAVDRAGSGDLHAVKIKLENDFKDDRRRKKPADVKEWNRLNEASYRQFRGKITEIRGELMALPVHFKYLAIMETNLDLVMGAIGPVLYSPDGIGRIGIITIRERAEELPIAATYIAPERFRVDAAKLTRIEKNLINNKKVRPDIEVRI